MVLNGVLSSWEALETNWLRDMSSFSSRSDMELKALASWANSFLPRTSTRLERSPRLMRDMPGAQFADGPGDSAHHEHADDERGSRHQQHPQEHLAAQGAQFS